MDFWDFTSSKKKNENKPYDKKADVAEHREKMMKFMFFNQIIGNGHGERNKTDKKRKK